MSKGIKRGISGYRIFSRAYFYLPFLTVYLLEQGCSIFETSAIMAIYGIAAFTFTQIASKNRRFKSVSQKQLLIGSELLKIGGLLLIIMLKNELPALVLGQGALGVSYAMAAGQDTKIIRQYIREPGFQEKSNSYMFLSLLIAGFIGSMLYEANPVFPFMASIITSAIGICFCISLPNEDSSIQEYEMHEISEQKLTVNEKKTVCRFVLVRGIVLTMFTGFLPVYLWNDLRTSAYTFIFILSSYTIMGNIGSNFILRHIGIRRAAATMDILLPLALFMLLSGNTVGIILAALMLGIVSGMIRPYCMKQIEKEKLNQALVTMETSYALLNVSLLIGCGFLYQGYAFQHVVLVFCIIWLFIPLSNVYFRLHKSQSLPVNNVTEIRG